MNKKTQKIISKISALLIGVMPILSLDTTVLASNKYDYSNPIYSEGIDDEYVYDTNDSVVITKTDVPRNLPKVINGRYERSSYPIPMENRVPDKETYELIKAENKEIMDKVEEDIKNGTLTKHIAADGQFYGTVPDDVLGVEKKIYVNTNVKGAHSLASYVPAGEIATVRLNDEALKYAQSGQIRITFGQTMIDAEQYEHNSGAENRMPYLGKIFNISERETKVGTPFGGMVSLYIDESVPSGLNFEIEVSGVIDTPYYDLGKTTKEEWQKSKDAPGLFAEIRTPYLRFFVPSKFIRHVDDPYKALLFWTNSAALSSNVMNLMNRNKPMTLTFDSYITVGIAYASVGMWTCNLPADWAVNALDYEKLVKDGNWGLIHEINHHYQRRYSGYSDEWGLGDEFSEITNNVLSTLSYILYSNIAAYRGEEGTDDWNKVADPYSSLKQQIFEGVQYYADKPNQGNFAHSMFAHELGALNYANVIKSTYDGGTFNGIYIPPYDYKLESEGKKLRQDRYDDFAYRICAASERDYTWYIQNELRWPLKSETVTKIKSLGYEEVIPVESVYAMGEVGKETGRPFYIPSSGYVFDFEKSLVSKGKVTILDISKPKYGTLTERSDGKYDYKADLSMPENAKDEFILTVQVEDGGIVYVRKLNCTIGFEYNSSIVENYDVVKWDIYEALEDVIKKQPYSTSSSNGMKINTPEGDKLAKSQGYFIAEESGEYEFQVFGDDRTAFILSLEDGRELQSIVNDYAKDADDAKKLSSDVDSNGRAKSTSFTLNLEAGKAYSYTLIGKNIGGVGWADVNIRRTSGDTSWKLINSVYSSLDDLGKKTDKTYEMPKAYHVRPSSLSAASESLIKGMKVISTPQGVTYNGDPASLLEGNKDNIVDGDLNTYFHSSYNDDKTPFPHEYIIDLGGEKSFNKLEIYTRRPWQGDTVGVIGDYEIYVADEYDGENTNWTKIADDYTRQGKGDSDILISFKDTTAKYLKIKALNNRDGRALTILSEVRLAYTSKVQNVIAQNSSYIQYNGKWTKKTGGAFVNGATYNSTDGYFMYCFEGSESNIYVTQDVEVEMRIDGGKWHRRKLTGSLREPSITLKLNSNTLRSTDNGEHVVEVRAIGGEIALNMISTDGTFYKGKAPDLSKPPVITGASNIEIGIGQVDSFNKKEGITVSDDVDKLTMDDVIITGEIEKPLPGSSKVSELIYSLKDSDNNETIVKRQITVTNQVPVIKGLNEIVMKIGTKVDLKDGITAEDYEDKDLTDKVVLEGILNSQIQDTELLSVGEYEAEYSVTDSDKNTTKAVRKLKVLKSDAPIIHGVKNIEIGIGQVDTFDEMAGISYTDDNDVTGLTINVTGTLGKPSPGTNEDYILTYSVTDSDGNTTSIDRVITVTNQKPEIQGLSDITINECEGSEFDFAKGVTAEDLEDGNLTNEIKLPVVDLSKLSAGTHKITYSVTDSDGNYSEFERIVFVLENASKDDKPEDKNDSIIDKDEKPEYKPDKKEDNIIDKKEDNEDNIQDKNDKIEEKEEDIAVKDDKVSENVNNENEDIQTGDSPIIKYVIVMLVLVLVFAAHRKKSISK